MITNQCFKLNNVPEYRETIERIKEICTLNVLRNSKEEIVKYFKFDEDSDCYYFPRFAWTCISAKELNLDVMPNLDRELMQSDLKFVGDLYDYQEDATSKTIKQLKEIGGGVLNMPPGFGKTVVCCKIICELKLKSFIIVHTDALLEQWMERIHQYIPNAKVCKFEKSKSIEEYLQYDIIVGIVNSVSKYESNIKIIDLLVFDEAHHIGTNSALSALRKFDSKYVMGLTATPCRKSDHKTDLIFLTLGPVSISIKDSYSLILKHITLRFNQAPELKRQSKKRKFAHNKNVEITENITRLAECNERTISICKFIMTSNKIENIEKRCLLFLCKRIHTVNFIFDYFKKNYPLMKISKVEKKKPIPNDISIIVSTDQKVSEGFDFPRIDTLVRVLPSSEDEQTIGRVMRMCENKISPVVIVDILDNTFPIFVAMYNKRNRIIFQNDMSQSVRNRDTSHSKLLSKSTKQPTQFTIGQITKELYDLTYSSEMADSQSS